MNKFLSYISCIWINTSEINIEILDERYIPDPYLENIDAMIEKAANAEEEERPCFEHNTNASPLPNQHLIEICKECNLKPHEIDKIMIMSKTTNLCKAMIHDIENHDMEDSNECDCFIKTDCDCYLCNIDEDNEVNHFNRLHGCLFDETIYNKFKKYRDNTNLKSWYALKYSQHCHGCGQEIKQSNYGNVYCDDYCRTRIENYRNQCCFANSPNGCEICNNN